MAAKLLHIVHEKPRKFNARFLKLELSLEQETAAF